MYVDVRYTLVCDVVVDQVKQSEETKLQIVQRAVEQR